MTGVGPEAEAALRQASAVDVITAGRRTGRAHRVPVWFVYRDGALYFLAHARGHGRGTDWYQNLVAAGGARVVARGQQIEVRPAEFPSGVDAHAYVVSLFEAKYGAGAIDTWYDRTLRIPLRAVVTR
jgi:deazaflavin-dependent oxidoreductase (nitroreductase family)